MTSPRLLLVHDRVRGPTGMGQVAEWITRTTLEGGWEVTLVTAEVADDLRAECRVLDAPAVRSLPALPQHLAWLASARRSLRRAGPADVVHVHAPALIGHGDLMTCHHLAGAAAEHGVSAGPRRLRRLQSALTIALDDRWYRRRDPRTRMSFVSEFLRDEFRERFGEPLDGAVIAPPAPEWNPVAVAERTAAQETFGVNGARLTVGYLGGDDPRKGIDAVTDMCGSDDLDVMIAGPGSAELSVPGARCLGFVDPDLLAAASDVIVAPALFDAAPVAVLQPLARGIPVVVGPACGWAPAIERLRAGVVWRREVPLASAVRAAFEVDAAACRTLVEDVSSAHQRERLLAAYGRVVEHGGRRRDA